jgi:hypothetical protein
MKKAPDIFGCLKSISKIKTNFYPKCAVFLDFFFGVIRFHIGVVGCGKLGFGIPAFFER